MELGTIVQLLPNCWCRDVTNLSHRRHETHLNSRFNHRLFKVVALNAAIPVDGSCTANTLVASLDSEDMIAVNMCNVIPVKNIQIKFIMNGKDVTDLISDKTKSSLLFDQNS